MAGRQHASFARVPFLFGAAEAAALPGPILVRLMADLGGTPEAAKSVLHRMTDFGLLELTRHGRVGVYRLAGQMRHGFESIRDRTVTQSDLDGRLHAVVYDVPESRRAFRDALRTALHRHGYRQLRPGVMLGGQDRSEALGSMLADSGAVAGWWDLEREQMARVVAQCWPVDELASRYRACIRRLEQVAESDPGTGADALRTLHDATAEAYALMAEDATLPRALLPADWPLRQLADASERVWINVGHTAAEHVQRVIEDSRYAHLVEADTAWASADREAGAK
ncbi:hypothetical protein CGZ93_08085 [Enemella dayhoffiae]|uniref:Uncharacterized protein n=1 Tax=Enemella dayhoffiae TaxID=2016507 RepID=A0A255H3C2_9ACTN|nr:PaaX family transcriptional regulator C-terminal domain-containing protein [Enemella dayhoffiae]OYO21892.1 hypothetical protein CGZ93_08085 [Enemella dayhoffiae]